MSELKTIIQDLKRAISFLEDYQHSKNLWYVERAKAILERATKHLDMIEGYRSIEEIERAYQARKLITEAIYLLDLILEVREGVSHGEKNDNSER